MSTRDKGVKKSSGEVEREKRENAGKPEYSRERKYPLYNPAYPAHTQLEDEDVEWAEACAESLSHKEDIASAIEDIDMSTSHNRSKWSKVDKCRAVVLDTILGNHYRVSRKMGIPYDTVKEWKYKSPWWQQVKQAFYKEQGDALDRAFSTVMDKALGAVIERLDNGDEVISKGQIIRKKVPAMDAVKILGIVYDKRAMLRGDPTSRQERTVNPKNIEYLRGQFEKIAQNVQEKGEVHIQEEIEDGTWREKEEE